MLEAAQPTKVEFKFSEDVLAGIYAHALVLKNTLVSVRSDGQRHSDFFKGCITTLGSI